MHNVPVHLRTLLAAGHSVRSTTVAKADLAEDGTEKLLLRLHDGESVECVIIPDGERTTLASRRRSAARLAVSSAPLACSACAATSRLAKSPSRSSSRAAGYRHHDG
jgi:adenine C2-methylase RlmN of 23S rRNA A2503 and tRNA A37